MKKNNVLILLGIVLFAVVVFLSWYAYNLSKQPLVSPTVNNVSQPVKQKINSIESNAENIKQNFTDSEGQINNPKDGQLNEEDQLKITGLEVTSIKGSIESVSNNSLTVEFDYQGTKWSSVVEINQNSTIYLPAPNANSMGEVVGLGELKAGDMVIVNGEGNILNQDSFIALSVHKTTN